MQVQQAISSVAVVEKLTGFDFSFNTSLTLSKNIDELQKVLDLFNEKRTALVDKLKVDEEIPEDKHEEFDASMNDILLEEVDVDIIKIKSVDLNDAKISPAEVKQILFLIDQ